MKSLLTIGFVLTVYLAAAGDMLRDRLQAIMDSIVDAESWPGLTLAVELPDGRRLHLAAGWADREAQVPMTPAARMPAGSVGKIFVAPLVLQLVAEQQLDLDAPLQTWLGTEPWFERLPNAGAITLRMLLNHSSGLPRYIFTEGFLAAAKAEPMKAWRPEELLAFIFDAPPVHEAGDGWAYSDTNYILLGMLIERWAGQPYYQVLKQRILHPYSLNNTMPADRRDLPGLTQGYIGEENFMNLPPKVVADGKYAMNPQFEWTGGGVVSTSGDLAYWLKQIHEGEVIPAGLYKPMISPVDFRSGEPATTGYGLGTFVWPTSHGLHYGHAGLFMGYLTIAEYSPDYRFSLALQTNTDATLGRSMHRHALRLSNLIVEELTGRIKADEAAIRSLFRQQEECWSKQDADCYLQAYLPSGGTRKISPSGILHGFDPIARAYKDNQPPGEWGRLSFGDLNLERLRTDLYYITGRYDLKSRTHYFSVLMQKVDGRWYIVADHSG